MTTQEQPAVVRIPCESGAEYDIFVYSFTKDALAVRTIVDKALEKLYLDDETGEVLTIDEAILNLADSGIYPLSFIEAETAY